jgi:chaperonin GroEL
MPAKRIFYHAQAREPILAGASAVAKAVKVTYGPRGRNVIIEKSFGTPQVTQDGATVASQIELEDLNENLGAQLIRQAAAKTSDVAGDGTTTACILTESIVREGLKLCAGGCDPMSLARGIEKGLQAALESISKESKPLKSKSDVAQIANIASSGDSEVGEWVASAVDKAGRGGVVTVEEGKTLQTTLEAVEGMQFDRGYISPYFITDKNDLKCVLEDVHILLYEKKIEDVEEFLPLLEKMAKSGRPFLAISDSVEGEALATLVVNKLRGILKCAAVKAPGYGDRRKAQLTDIAVVTGGNAILEDSGMKLDTVELSDLGRAKKVIIAKEETTIIEGAGKKSAVEGRIEQIRKEIEKSTSDYDKEHLRKREGSLAGGVIRINVGGATEVDVKARKARMENALNAVRSAQEEGVVPGGGVAFLSAAESVGKLRLSGDELSGARIFARALEEPIKQLAENSGADGEVVLHTVRESKKGVGYDVLAQKYRDMVSAGIIDSAKVLKTALSNAVSVATMLLTTEASITEAPKKKEGKKKGKQHPAAQMPEDMGEDMYGEDMY